MPVTYSIPACSNRRVKFIAESARGTEKPGPEFIDFVYESFRAMEKGLGLELLRLIEFYNKFMLMMILIKSTFMKYSDWQKPVQQVVK